MKRKAAVELIKLVQWTIIGQIDCFSLFNIPVFDVSLLATVVAPPVILIIIGSSWM